MRLGKAYTLAEIVVVMLIIAVVVGVSIKVTKSRLDNILSYTYYSTYSTLRSVTANMLADYNPDDDLYKANNNFYPTFIFSKNNKLLTLLLNNFGMPVFGASGSNICVLQSSSSFSYDSLLDACVSVDAAYYDYYAGLYTPYACKYSYTRIFFYDGYVPGNYEALCGYNIKKSCCNATIIGASMADLMCEPYGGEDYDGCGDDTVEPPVTPEEPDTPVIPVCSITPTDAEVESKYCLGKEFDNSPYVCGWVDITPWPPACETGKEWSAEHCQCVAIPATIPKKGANFCELFERLVNINPSDSTCNGSSIDTSTTEFADLTPDIILRNGIRLYNLHQDPVLIPQLRITGVDDEAADKDTNQKGYIIYADVDGSKGNSVLWEDVYPFYITLSGRVVPAYDENANPDGSGGDSENHLQVSVKNETFNANGYRVIKWLSKSVSFKEGACQSGYIDELTDYCNGVSYDSECELSNSNCQLKAIQPLKFF